MSQLALAYHQLLINNAGAEKLSTNMTSKDNFRATVLFSSVLVKLL